MAIDFFTIRKGLEINTDLTSGAVIVQILTGSADPSAGGGVEANVGSLYLRSNGLHYRKVGVADTAWEAEPDLSIISGDLASLSSAIDNNTTNITTISGDIAVINTDLSTLSSAIDSNTSDIVVINSDLSTLSGAIDGNSGDILTIQNDLTSGFVTTTTNQTISGQKTFVGDMLVSADLTVLGTVTSLSATDLEVSDNTILLNSGETGAGVTLGTAGIEIDRGTSTNVQLRWNETSDTWEITYDGVTYYDILTELDLSATDLSTLSAAIDQNSTDITGISGIVGSLASGNYIVGTTVAGDLTALDTNLATVSGDLDALEAIVGAPLSAGSVIGGVSVADDLVALDNQISTLNSPITGGASAVTSPTVIDTVSLASYDVAGWEVMSELDSDTTRRRANRVNALHSGAGAIDVDNFSLLAIGAPWAGYDVDVVVSGAVMALVVDSTQATTFKSLRLFNL